MSHDRVSWLAAHFADAMMPHKCVQAFNKQNVYHIDDLDDIHTACFNGRAMINRVLQQLVLTLQSSLNVLHAGAKSHPAQKRQQNTLYGHAAEALALVP